MTNSLIVLIIMLITIGMTIFNLLLNKILGLKREEMKKIREKALNLRERMKNAQAIGDPQLLIQIQRETIQLTNQMMRKQLLPMCLKCFVFIGIFTALSFILADYDSGLLPFPLWFFGSGWFAVYFIFSISFSLIIFGGKILYKKVTHKETKTQSNLRELVGLLTTPKQEYGISHQYSDSIQSQILQENSSENVDTWKDRIKDL
ncbi:MAG: EMC3/TMCO1 family protein [Promethearchaeota archaeon]